MMDWENITGEQADMMNKRRKENPEATVDILLRKLSRSVDELHRKFAESLRQSVEEFNANPSVPWLVARILATADVIEASSMQEHSVKAPLGVVPEDAA